MPDQPAHDPSTNCYCGGPEEIYPHQRGTELYCRPDAAVPGSSRRAGESVPVDLGGGDRVMAHVLRVSDDGTVTRVTVADLAERASWRAGYAEAIARLRDDERYRYWWTARPYPPEDRYWESTPRGHLADYLQTVGPDGPDVTKPINTVERPEATAARYAIELHRLWTELAARGIPLLLTSPGDRAAVDTALDAIDCRTTVIATLTALRRLDELTDASDGTTGTPGHPQADPTPRQPTQAATVDQHNNAEADHG